MAFPAEAQRFRFAAGVRRATWRAGLAAFVGAPAHLDAVRTANETSADPFALEPMLSTAELSALLGVPVSTVYGWRVLGRGPVAHRVGKHLRYTVSDVRDWIDARREAPPSGTGAATPFPGRGGAAGFGSAPSDGSGPR
ncbi:MAG: helix-turn-helix domain-containing protein [Bifidobacteriaceae bacterium]|nr:helix-turn-helix domain-containing protein [Bifidobacteriaceae bacterium]